MVDLLRRDINGAGGILGSPFRSLGGEGVPGVAVQKKQVAPLGERAGDGGPSMREGARGP